MQFMNMKKLLCTLAIPMTLCQVAQGQTISSRLLAQAHSSNDGATFHKQDSTVYNYLSNNRGGDLNTQLKFDMATKWLFIDDTTTVNNQNFIQEFDSSNNLTSNITQFWTGSAWVNVGKSLYFYDSTKRLSYMISQTWGGSSWTNVSKNQYTYTTGAQLLADSYMTWDGTSSTFLPSTQIIYYYDLAGNKTQEVRQMYNWTTLAYDYADRALHTYSATNKLLSTTYSTWSGSAWVNSTLNTYAYDSGDNRISELFQIWNSLSMTWDNNTLHTFSSFTTMHMPQVDILQTWLVDSAMWNNSMKTTNTYNSFGQLTSAISQSWNVAGFWEYALGDPKANYYYGPYLVAAVTNIANVGGDVKMYPVPAQNMLHLDLKWEEAQAADIAIFDVAGKTVVNFQTPVAAQYHSAVPVGNFADGVYIVKINGKNGQIVKQMVIAH
jgi:hypothetical protein